jgi:hypothetical protein
MSNTYINQITLDCFRNKEQYNILKTNSSKSSKKDTHFYRKRIVQLTKDLLSSDDQLHDLFPDIKYAFDIYVKNCVEYFKTLDKSDILQEDYKNMNDTENVIMDDYNCDMLYNDESTKTINKLIMKKTKNDRHTLDKFITRTIIKIDEPFMPVQKEINLNDPNLRIKGIRKKKNIHNIYDETPEPFKKKEDDIP